MSKMTADVVDDTKEVDTMLRQFLRYGKASFPVLGLARLGTGSTVLISHYRGIVDPLFLFILVCISYNIVISLIFCSKQ